MNSRNHLGAYGELYVTNYLLENGMEVFRNVAPSGPADLIAWNKETGKTVLIDVKCVRDPYIRKDGSYSLPKNPQWSDGIAVVVYVHGEVAVRLPDGFWEAL
jgi:hypothetical protein